MSKIKIIAEAGVNHNGDMGTALKLIDGASKAGADFVKFQTYIPEKVVSHEGLLATYQKKNLNKNITQIEMLRKYALSFDQFQELKNYADFKKIKFLSTPFDEESLDFLVDIGIEYIKVSSGEITNVPLLRKIEQKKIPIILSTGLSKISEIKNAIDILSNSQMRRDITLLHCTSEYPAPFKDVNLNAIHSLKKNFNFDVGYSDHTIGIEASIAASVFGISILEKHFTINKLLDGPDHIASIDLDELNLMVKSIRNIEKALGDGIKRPGNSELKNLKNIRRSIYANKMIVKGEKFTEKNLITKRPANGICASKWDLLIGKVSSRDYPEDSLIKEDL